MSTDHFEDLLLDSHTRLGVRQIVDDALRSLDPRVAQLCIDRLAAYRERVARHPPDEDQNLP
jgi:hypothetical protein